MMRENKKKESKMPTQTTEGTGPGSVDRFKSRILNGDVRDSNLQLATVLNGGSADLENVQLIKAPDGTESSMDGKNLVIKGGEGYTNAGEEDDADGGHVTISGGMQHGDGNSGDVIIHGGDSSTDFENSDAGDVVLRGGDGLGPGDSDGGDVTIRGGNCEFYGSEGEAGSVEIRGGNSFGSSGGSVILEGGYSNQTGGSIQIVSGSGSQGGDISIEAGDAIDSGKGGDIYMTAGNNGSQIILQSMVRMPIFATMAVRDQLFPTPQKGCLCFVEEVNSLTIYTGTAWANMALVP
jgi:hypothetical protein